MAAALTTSGHARAEEAGAGMQSPAAFGVGLVLSSIGVAGVSAGGYLFASGSGACDGISRDRLPSDAEIAGCTAGVNQQLGGIVALVSGGGFFLGGIPVMAVGATPADDVAPVAVSLDVAPSGASLTFSF